MKAADISVRIGCHRLNSPLIIGSHDGLTTIKDFTRLAEATHGKLGAFVVKTMTIPPRKGNLLPHVAFTSGGILVSSGLKNPGISSMAKDIGSYVAKFSGGDFPSIIASIATDPTMPWKSPEKELLCMALQLVEIGVGLLELNLSCPNTNLGGMPAQDPNLTYRIIYHLKNELLKRGYSDVALIPKLTGFDADISSTTSAAEKAGADAVVLSNIPKASGCYTGVLQMIPGMKFGDPLIGNVQGGITGESLGPIVREMVRKAHNTVSIPIIATGGCLGGLGSGVNMMLDGFLQTIMHGATAVEAVTPFYPVSEDENMLKMIRLVNGLGHFLNSNKTDLGSIKGMVPELSRGKHSAGEIKKVLIIGLGNAGRNHRRVWDGMGIETAAVDVNKNRAQDAAGTRVFTALSEALKTFAPDLIDICTPTGIHADILEQVLSAAPGARIILEKPVTNNAKDFIALRRMLEGGQPSENIFVNENYLFSRVLSTVKSLMLKHGIGRHRIFTEFSKDRSADEKKGRFVDEHLGAFGIEISHPLAMVLSLGAGKKIKRVLHTNFTPDKKNDREARLIYITHDGTLVHVYESLAGRADSAFGGGGYDPNPNRRLLIEGADGKRVLAEFEPIAGKVRFLGRVTVFEGDRVIETVDDIEENSLQGSLSAAKSYFEDQRAKNPSSLQDGLEVAEMLLQACSAGSVLPRLGAGAEYDSDKQWKFAAKRGFRLPEGSVFALIANEVQTDRYFADDGLSGPLAKLRETLDPQTGATHYQRVIQFRVDDPDRGTSRYIFREETLDREAFDSQVAGLSPYMTIVKRREKFERDGVILHVDNIRSINGEELSGNDTFVELVIKDPALTENATAIAQELGFSQNDAVSQPYVEIFSAGSER